MKVKITYANDSNWEMARWYSILQYCWMISGWWLLYGNLACYICVRLECQCFDRWWILGLLSPYLSKCRTNSYPPMILRFGTLTRYSSWLFEPYRVFVVNQNVYDDWLFVYKNVWKVCVWTFRSMMNIRSSFTLSPEMQVNPLSAKNFWDLKRLPKRQTSKYVYDKLLTIHFL